MSDFTDQLETDMAVFFNSDEFGETATYNGTDITVVGESIAEFVTDIPGYVIPEQIIHVKTSDVSQPKSGDVVTFRSARYIVGPDSEAYDSNTWKIYLRKDTIQT